MITESNITVFSAYVEDRVTKWKTTQIRNVHWEESQGLNIIKSGIQGADRVKVFIPYSSLSEVLVIDNGYKGDGVTFKPGDYIVKGLVDDVITSAKHLEENYRTAVKITTVDNRTDALNKELWHYEIGGV